jgi:methylamine---glutamate N-methyltransferase subunit B
MKTIDAKTKDLKALNSALRESMNNTPVRVRNASHLHGLGAGMKHGEIIVESDVGDYVGVLNSGAKIEVTKDAGKYVGDNMTSGTVIIDGNAGYGAGQYCYGGTIVVRGNAGDFTATMNKGAVIIIAGNVGDEVGTYMLKGDLIVIGDAGVNFANYLIRGSVYIGGNWQSIGHNTKIEPLSKEDIAKLQAFFENYQIQADPTIFKKIVAASEKPFYN